MGAGDQRAKRGVSPKSPKALVAQGLSLGGFVEREYWPVVSAGLSPEWLPRATQLTGTIVEDLGSIRLDQLGREVCAHWWARLATQLKTHPRTANLRLIRLRHVCRKAREWGYLVEDPTQGLRPLREVKDRVRYLSEDQRQALLAGANPDLRRYLVVARYTAGRRRSLRDLRWGDVDFVAGTITFRGTKTGSNHKLPLAEALRLELESWGPGAPQDHVLPVLELHSITQAFRRLVKRVLGPGSDFRFHDLRHDVASSLVMAGESLPVVQAVLGHATPAMTSRYAHLAPSAITRALGRL